MVQLDMNRSVFILKIFVKNKLKTSFINVIFSICNDKITFQQIDSAPAQINCFSLNICHLIEELPIHEMTIECRAPFSKSRIIKDKFLNSKPEIQKILFEKKLKISDLPSMKLKENKNIWIQKISHISMLYGQNKISKDELILKMKDFIQENYSHKI